MTPQKKSRRSLLAGLAGFVGLSTVAGKAAAAVATPSTAAGPYYPRPAMRRADADNDLVKIIGRVEEAGGEVITLRGTISDRDGQRLAGHRVEIWQCDVDGNYLHTSDPRSVDFDPSFQGFGHDITDENGGYVFRTIKPTVYPGRTPHIHMKVFDGASEVLTTQFYIKDHPNNARDSLFRRMSAADAEALSMVFVDGDEGLETTVDVVI